MRNLKLKKKLERNKKIKSLRNTNNLRLGLLEDSVWESLGVLLLLQLELLRECEPSDLIRIGSIYLRSSSF